MPFSDRFNPQSTQQDNRKLFTSQINDPDLIEELPNLAQYMSVIGDVIVMPALKREHPQNFHETWGEMWEDSGLKDPIILEMTDIVIKFYGLYTILALRYLALRHFHKRLDILHPLIREEYQKVKATIHETLTEEDVHLLNLLADYTSEMRRPLIAFNEDLTEFYQMMCHSTELFSGVHDIAEFKKREKFIKHTDAGHVIQRLAFIRIFEERSRKQRPQESQYLSISTERIYRAIMESGHPVIHLYEKYKQDPLKYVTSAYTNYQT